MIKSIAVSTIVVTIILHVNFVCGQNNATVSTSHNTSASTTTLNNTETKSTIIPSGIMSESQSKSLLSTIQSTSVIPSATRSRTVTSSVAFLSSTSTYFRINTSSSFYANNSSGYGTSSNPSFTSSTFTSSSFNLSSHNSKTTVDSFNSTSHLSATDTMQPTSQSVFLSSTRTLYSPETSISRSAISSTLVESSRTLGKSNTPSSSSFNSSITTSHSKSSSLSSTTFSTRLPTAFSTSMVATSDTVETTTSTSSHESSPSHSSSGGSDFPPSTSRLNEATDSRTISSMTTSGYTTFAESTKIMTVWPASSETPIVSTVSSTTKETASQSSTEEVKNMFLEINGKLVLSPKSNAYDNDLKKLADSIESILDKALKDVSGYIYSKVLTITTQENQSKFDCIFKSLIRQPSSETASKLLERIVEYNKTNGFGQFRLHSVETVVPRDESSSKERLYLWAIVVIAVLGVLCLIFLVALVYTRRKLGNKSSPKQENNSNHIYTDFFPPVFDGNEESQNVPLKLTSVSSTESKQPLKLSDAVDTDSNPEEGNGNKSDGGSTEDKPSTQKPFEPANVTLHVQDTDDEEDQTKFSTFSRKR